MAQHLLNGSEARGPRWEPRLPPRGELPRGIEPDGIPWLGTTWYERGLAYWARRLGGLLFAATMLALYTGILFLFFQGVYQSPDSHAFFYGLLIFEIAYSLATGGWLLVRSFRKPADTPATAGTRQIRRLAGLGAGLGLVARVGSILATGFLVLLAALSYGVVLWLFAGLFAPVLPVERQARRRLTQARRLQRFLMPQAGTSSGL